jgi:hypothetical protein
VSEPGSERERGAAHPERRATNRLASETSAYLRQHMHNPVDWHPWGAEALARAHAEDKPLLVSIGYSACHWCHVMERESFEDPETAALMNRLFVNVKVDREERPDVDQIYMDTVVRMTGHGGWPLTVFCTPDGRPFHAGTYFPPEPRHGLPSFRQLLEAVADAWTARRPAVEEQAGRLVGVLRERARGVAEAPPGRATLARAAREILAAADREHGGFGSGPKFPTPPNLEVLLAACDELPAAERGPLLDFVAFTCREMARRGLYDALGGGFHRYCVDGHWGIPHFEKMLYDQGQLLRVYAEAWRRTGDDDLVWPIRETFAYLAREMTAPEGGFFASQDADSEGVEGKFYAWTPDQVRAALGPGRGDAFCRAFAVTPEGNFERGTSVLWDLAREPRDAFAAERALLFRARGARVPPATDRKRLAAWNGYAVSGLSFAGSLLADAAMLEAARSAAEFVLAHLRDERGRLLRSFDAGRAVVPAFLDDVASLANACLDLHRAGAGDGWLVEGVRFAEDVARRFFDADEGDLFLSADDAERLAVRPRGDHDGATPHSTGQALLALVRAGALAGRADLASVAARVARTHAFALGRAPAAHPTLARAVALLERGVSVAVVVGDPGAPATRALAGRARRILGPEDAVVVAAPEQPAPGLDPAWLRGRGLVNGRPAAYVCRGTTCSLPATDPAALAPLAAGG